MASLAASFCSSPASAHPPQLQEFRSDPCFARSPPSCNGGGGSYGGWAKKQKQKQKQKPSSPSPSPSSSSSAALAGSFFVPSIHRFPPNFVRQLSVKARRNCSNIGVAQVVAASAMNPPPSSPTLVLGNGAGPTKMPVSTLIHEANENKANDSPSSPLPRSSAIATAAVHAGERGGRPKISDSLTTPIVQTSTYTFQDTAELIAYQEGTYTSFEYGRYGNPTTQTAEKKISALEGAETTLMMSSGMNAATVMLLALVPKDGHIVTTTDCYRRTRQFIQTFLPKMGVTASVVDPADLTALERALVNNKVSIFFSESPTNPYLRCIDIEAVSKLCHDNGALVCIDGTFATPINQRALELGADMVLHSATKYLAGHNDVLAGSISGSKEVISAVRNLHNIMGGVIDPNSAYLIIRGMKTLHLRVKQQNETALKLAQKLEQHRKVVRVHYPGLESHPEHHIAKRQMSGFGGVISFEVKGDLEATSRFIDSLKIPYIAPSLGGCESLVEQPTIISYWDQSPDERARLGIKDNLVRFSCGIESFEDLYDDILVALNAV